MPCRGFQCWHMRPADSSTGTTDFEIESLLSLSAPPPPPPRLSAPTMHTYGGGGDEGKSEGKVEGMGKVMGEGEHACEDERGSEREGDTYIKFYIRFNKM